MFKRLFAITLVLTIFTATFTAPAYADDNDEPACFMCHKEGGGK